MPAKGSAIDRSAIDKSPALLSITEDIYLFDKYHPILVELIVCLCTSSAHQKDYQKYRLQVKPHLHSLRLNRHI